jgi:acyl-CoA reductase-like NAD-dependent aldehyde dehydrogenase
VEESVFPEFEAECAKLGAQWAAGDGMASDSKIGPMVSAMQRDAVAAQVDAAVASGARIVAQAPVPDAPGGNYYPATVISGVTQDMAIQHSELFGPVVALASFSGSEKEAVDLSNDTEYGLAAYVYSKDLEKASRVAMGVQAGQVGINNWSMLNAPGGAPWVGHKASGVGYHSGADGWRQFSVPKTLVFESVADLRAAQLVTEDATATL